MNKNNAHLYIPHIEALRDGELQLKHGGSWVGVIDTDFHEPPETYRRKPKPREFYCNIHKTGGVYAHHNLDSALRSRGDGGAETIRVREIID